MIINLVLFFIPKRQEIYRLYLIKKRKKLACMRLNSKIYIYSGRTGDKAQTISFQFQQDAHMTGILYIDYNRYIGIFAFGRMSGVANILNSAATVIPSLNSHDNTVSVNLTIWGNCKLITMDRNVKVIGSL